MTQNTVITIAENQPTTDHSFVAKRTLRHALRFLKRAGDAATLRVCHYGDDPRDVRYVVNYATAPRKPARWSYDRTTARKVRKSPARMILLPDNLKAQA